MADYPLTGIRIHYSPPDSTENDIRNALAEKLGDYFSKNVGLMIAGSGGYLFTHCKTNELRDSLLNTCLEVGDMSLMFTK